MKFAAALAAAALPLALGEHDVTIKNQQGCINPADFDPNFDYFPDKVATASSEFWDIEYHNTYKILTNEIDGKSYLLYQCGTEIPASEFASGHDGIFSVPIEDGVALSSTTEIPFFELLGLRSSIQGYLGPYSQLINSPCVKKLLADGDIVVAADPTNAANVNALLTSEGTGKDIVALTKTDSLFTNTLYFTESSEKTNLGTLEWVKFVSTLFNQEAVANHKYEEIVDRYECMVDNAAIISSDAQDKPTIVWARYTNYSGVDGFDVAECPNYYCQFAEACSADMLWSTEGSKSDEFGGKYMTINEFADFAKDAEHWIYPSYNWEEGYNRFKSILDQFTSVKYKEVYDYSAYGSTGWFEQRIIEPDAVLEDFCSIVGNTQGVIKKSYFRNVFTEDVGPADSCPDVSAPWEMKSSACLPMVANQPQGAGGNEASGATRFGASLLAAVIAMVAFM